VFTDRLPSFILRFGAEILTSTGCQYMVTRASAFDAICRLKLMA
jgi:hypothetical protein